MASSLHCRPASIAYNDSSSLSRISAQFVKSHFLPVSDGRTSCTVSVPTLEGSFTYLQQFVVCNDIEVDAVLGSDWLGICRLVSNEGRVKFPVSSPEYNATCHRDFVGSAVANGVSNTFIFFFNAHGIAYREAGSIVISVRWCVLRVIFSIYN